MLHGIRDGRVYKPFTHQHTGSGYRLSGLSVRFKRGEAAHCRASGRGLTRSLTQRGSTSSSSISLKPLESQLCQERQIYHGPGPESWTGSRELDRVQRGGAGPVPERWSWTGSREVEMDPLDSLDPVQLSRPGPALWTWSGSTSLDPVQLSRPGPALWTGSREVEPDRVQRAGGGPGPERWSRTGSGPLGSAGTTT